MAKVDVKNLKNEKTKDLTLSTEVFGVEVNDIVLKKAIDLQLAASRQGTAKTKTRSEVSGGGKKPWRQKGTGRARQGSTRATQWRGGGIAGGVTPRDYTFKMNKKERVLALKSALTHKLKDKELVVVESLAIKSMKTKEVKEMIEAMKLTGKVLFIGSSESDLENLYMASRNLGYVYVMLSDEINAFDLINADSVVVEEAAIKEIEEALK
ncbi:MAG: 50S ribosomal protein L4 [Bacilli bacterium]|nr:50S ribosomal protein L4 [Bacilli bacterium]